MWFACSSRVYKTDVHERGKIIRLDQFVASFADLGHWIHLSISPI